MTWVLYVVLVSIVAAGVPTAVWLKRAGDRSWRIHKRRVILVRLIADTSGFQAAIREAGESVARLGTELRRAGGPLERTGRELDDILRRIRKGMRESIPELRDNDEKGTE